MPSEDVIALALLLMTVVGQLVATRWVSSIPQMFRRKEWLLERKIGKHKKEMETLNAVSSFAAYSKSQRELAKLEKEHEAAVSSRRQQPLVIRYAPYLVAVVAQCGFILPVIKLYGTKELVMVPNYLAFGFFRLVAFGDDATAAIWRLASLPLSAVMDASSPYNASVARGDEWLRSIGVLPWCVLCYVAWWHVRTSLWRS